MADFFFKTAWLIPLWPLLSFVLILAGGKRAPGQGAYLGIGAAFLSWVMAVGTAVTYLVGGHGYAAQVPWVHVGETVLPVGYSIDSLTVMMVFMVSLVSMLIQIYSIGYMHGDSRYPRFFAYMSLFTAAMLGLVLANNLIILFVCWELVGLCSYLLISFWFERPKAARAGKKAFLVTRLGDTGFIIGLVLLFSYLKTVQFDEVFRGAATLAESHPTLLFGACCALFCGAIGKSAQVPLHVWLPDAMEGPTPVSALIHAATMVVAGVYMVARLFPLFEMSGALLVVAYVGAITAFFAATIAILKNDIKGVLAYSTISQIGYMMFGLGVMGWTASVFHLFTHAFFKAMLFLCAGSVIHAVGTNDIMKMGGLRKVMPSTYWTMLIGFLALAGFPGFSGFWSKDEILLDALNWGRANHNYVIFALGFGAAFLTALYMSRMFLLVFHGEYRGDGHPHESPKVMTGPLWVFAAFAALIGLIGTPAWPWFQRTIFYGERPHIAEPNYLLMLASSLIAIAGIATGWALYDRQLVDRRAIIVPLKRIGLYQLLKNNYYVDNIYHAVFIYPGILLAIALARFDLSVIDGAVNRVRDITLVFSWISRYWDIWVVDGLVNLVGVTTKAGARVLRLAQTGLLQNYILFAVAGVLIALAFYLIVLT